jgi:hypothetical protein
VQAFRDQVLGEPVGDPAVGGSDAEDVGASVGVDEAPAALVGDSDREVAALGDLPGGVDPRSLVDDGYRVIRNRATDVRDGSSR